jgi:hypothetical protein
VFDNRTLKGREFFRRVKAVAKRNRLSLTLEQLGIGKEELGARLESDGCTGVFFSPMSPCV